MFTFCIAEDIICQSCLFAIDYCATFRTTIILNHTQTKEVKDELGTTELQEELKMNLETEREDIADDTAISLSDSEKLNSWSDADDSPLSPPLKKTKQLKT